jgi:glycerophosphoryl diester phosphodiesterase
MEWPAGTAPLIFGHRGASAYAPENTLAAFGLAADQGADGIEFDVQLSTDGWPVILHDFRVDRTTNGTGKVAELTLAQLRALDAGEGQSVPALDELFEMLGPRLIYNIELKNVSWRDRGLEAAVADCIQSYRLDDRVIVSSFNPLAIRRARRYLSPRTPVALLRAPPWMYRYGYWLADGEADHPHYSMVDADYMSWARRRGYRVHVWTVDDPAEAIRLADLGVQAIITNKPDLIRESLRDWESGRS